MGLLDNVSAVPNSLLGTCPMSVWKIGNYFGSDKLSLGRTFIYVGVTCINTSHPAAAILHTIFISCYHMTMVNYMVWLCAKYCNCIPLFFDT